VARGQRSSYLALANGSDVISSDDKRVGAVQRVLKDEKTNIFKGIVIDTQLGPGGLRFVEADQVSEIFERAVVLKLAAGGIDALPKPTRSQRSGPFGLL
jgi:hypothetical protein